MRKTGLLIATIGLLMAIAVPAVAAPPDREPVYGQEVMSAFLGVDREWTTNGNYHMRGWSAEYATTNALTHDYFDDMLVVLDVNWNLNLATGRGGMWGTFEYRDADDDGDRGWVGTFTAHWTEDGGWAGVGRGRGVGDYDGMQLRIDVWNDQPGVPQDEFDGYVFTPGN